PTSAELKEILVRTTGAKVSDVRPVFAEEEAAPTIEAMKSLVRQVVVSDPLQEVLVRMISALTPGSDFASDLVTRYVRYGPRPRRDLVIMLSANVFALLEGRINLAFEDIRQVIIPILRQRMISNFQS